LGQLENSAFIQETNNVNFKVNYRYITMFNFVTHHASSFNQAIFVDDANLFTHQSDAILLEKLFTNHSNASWIAFSGSSFNPFIHPVTVQSLAFRLRS
jgi:hypothetical protein